MLFIHYCKSIVRAANSLLAMKKGIVQTLSTVQARLLRLELVVLLSAFVLSILVLNRSVPQGAMGVVYSMSYVVVSYAVGLIEDGPFHHEAFVLWAAALLVIQASAMSTTEARVVLTTQSSASACQRECDHVQRKKLLLEHALQTCLVLWLIVNASSHNAWYRTAIWALWALSLFKTGAQMVEITRADRPQDPSVRAVAEYMNEYVAADDDQHSATDPATMQGYAYIFHGEERMEPVIYSAGQTQSTTRSVVMIDQVYQWIDQQPGSDFEKDKARDFCLAFALFKLLKRRFYGYVPAEAGSEEARSLVLNGLIHEGATGPDAAFRVVEAELAFLYDFFYTRNTALLVVGAKVYICITIAIACLTTLSVFFGTLAPSYRRLLVGLHLFDRVITVLVVVVTAGLEVCHTVMAGFPTHWNYINAVYDCVRNGTPWSGRRRGHHQWWKESIRPPENWVWEDKVGQYELLSRFSHRPCNLLSWLTLYLVEPRRQGQKRGRRKPLPREVKRAVLLWLKQNGGQLTAAFGGDDAQRWEVLAEFWTELVLFLAPSDNLDVQRRKLGTGGEFMTQLWVLLDHAGVFERPAATFV